jgi:hypothetical protein
MGRSEMTNNCIEHNYSSVSGYANTSVSGMRVALHRLVYCQYIGAPLDSIKGLVVRHTCDNARCINPEHLIIGTQADNMHDRKLRGGPTKRRLTEDMKYAIQTDYRTGKYTQRELQLKYNLSSSSITKIISGRER